MSDGDEVPENVVTIALLPVDLIVFDGGQVGLRKESVGFLCL